MTAQAVTAGTSLLLQVVAFLELGLAEYGAFAVFLALLVSVGALYTGYVGDSLAVLDRHEPDCRAGLVTSVVTGWTLALTVSAGLSLLIRPAELGTAAVYAAMVVLWLVRETVRRLLIARLEFARLVVNDTGCLVATVLALAGLYGVRAEIGLAALFAAMAAGSVASLLLGVWQLPATELRALRPGLAGMRTVAAFATWRALQAGLRPLTLLTARLFVASILSLSAVGLLEAARLAVAPLQVVINGSGSFLIGTFAARERAHREGGETRGGRGGLARSAAWTLAAVTVGGGSVLALVAGTLAPALTGLDLTVTLVLGWVAYLAVWAAGLPFVSELVARRMPREVFRTRLADSAAGLAAVVLALWAGAEVVAVPWMLAAAGLYSVWRLSGRAHRAALSRQVAHTRG